jgi:hypothetical protein
MEDRLSLQAVQDQTSSCLVSEWTSELASNWVDLVAPPEISASTQALLLLPCSDQAWLAWIPDYGEIILSVNQFYELHSWN